MEINQSGDSESFNQNLKTETYNVIDLTSENFVQEVIEK